MPLDNSCLGIKVGPWIFCLTLFSENIRNNFIQDVGIFKDRIIGHVFETEFTLNHVTGVSLAQYSMTVTRDDMTGIQCIPNELFHFGFGWFATIHLIHDLLQPTQYLLISQTM